MLEGNYKQQLLNGVALQRLWRPEVRPAIELAVAEEEDMVAHAMSQISIDRQKPIITPNMATASYEDSHINMSATLSIDDFPNDNFWLGNPYPNI